MLREAEVALAQGRGWGRFPESWGIGAKLLSLAQEYGGLKSSQAKRIKDLERENSRLKKAVADLTLDKLICERR